MNEDNTLSMVSSRLAEVRHALGGRHTAIPASEIIARGSRRRTRRVRAAAGAVCAVVATAIAAPLATGAGSQPAGATIRLASYSFRMPAGYLLTAATSPPCRAVAFAAPAPVSAQGLPVENPSSTAGMRAAASASGGCIVTVLLPPYTSTSVRDPNVPAAARRVQVGRYRGFIYSGRIYVAEVLGVAEHAIRPGWGSFTQLIVQLPAGGGMMRDLVIGARQLSGSALIEIAAHGLSSGNGRSLSLRTVPRPINARTTDRQPCEHRRRSRDVDGKTGGYRDRCRRQGPGWPVIMAAMAAAAVLLAACGGGGSSAQGSPRTGGKALAFAQCMRSHGEPGFPDPASNGIINTAKIDTNTSWYHEAFRTCATLTNFVPPFQLSPADQRRLMNDSLALSRCMRSHGIKDFPDPQFDPKTQVAYYAVPKGVQNSPAYRSAWNTCSRS